TGTGPSPGPAPPAPSDPPRPQSPHLVLSRRPARRRPVEGDRRQPPRVRGEVALNRHARTGSGISPPTRRNATDGDRSDPAATTPAGPPAPAPGGRPPGRPPGPGPAAPPPPAPPGPPPAGPGGPGPPAKMPASRVKTPRPRPAEERNRRSLSRTVSCGTPLA